MSAASGPSTPITPFTPSAAAAPTRGEFPPTNYSALVVGVLQAETARRGATSDGGAPSSGTVDQATVRQLLGLAASHLVTDTAMDAERGLARWGEGLTQLVELLVALHARGELELATVNEASKACSECWSVAGNWRGLEGSRDGVRAAAMKLKTLLDENGRTFGGARVYAP